MKRLTLDVLRPTSMRAEGVKTSDATPAPLAGGNEMTAADLAGSRCRRKFLTDRLETYPTMCLPFNVPRYNPADSQPQ